MIVFRLPYPPSTNRMWRRIPNRQTPILSREGRAYKATAAWVAASHIKAPIDGPIQVEYTLHPKLTKQGTASQVRIDLGNAEKVASDSLNGICWHDDKQLHRIVLTLGEPLPGGGLTARIDRWAPLHATHA